jgi:hypothetical protein
LIVRFNLQVILDFSASSGETICSLKVIETLLKNVLSKLNLTTIKQIPACLLYTNMSDIKNIQLPENNSRVIRFSGLSVTLTVMLGIVPISQ